MAERTWVYQKQSGGVIIATVTGLLTGDTSNALEILNYPDRTIQILGTLDPGGAYTIQGSQEDITAEYKDVHLLHDPTAQTFTSRTVKLMAGIVENPRFIKVIAVSGGTTDMRVVVTLYTAR